MRKRFLKISMYLSVFCTIFFSGCTHQNMESMEQSRTGKSEDAIKVENLRIENYFVKGKNIQTFDEVPQRVVVIGETETEALMALGIQDRIVMAFKSNDRGQNMRRTLLRYRKRRGRTSTSSIYPRCVPMSL